MVLVVMLALDMFLNCTTTTKRSSDQVMAWTNKTCTRRHIDGRTGLDADLQRIRRFAGDGSRAKNESDLRI